MSEDGKQVEPLVTPEMRAQIDAIRKQYANKKRYIAELKVDVTGYLEGTIDSWPAKIQDRIYNALRQTEERSGLKYTIKVSYCDVLPETNVPYLHVIATAEKIIQ